MKKEDGDLDVNALFVALCDPCLDVVAVPLDRPEELFVLHHVRPSALAVDEAHKAAVAVALLQVGPLARQDVRVHVALEELLGAAPASSAARHSPVRLAVLLC